MNPEEPLFLTAPAPIRVIAKHEAIGKVPLSNEVHEQVQTQARTLAETIAGMSQNDARYQSTLRVLEDLGNNEIQRSATVSNRLLDRPTKALSAIDEGSKVAKNLLDLRSTVERLDPANQDSNIFKNPKKIFGLFGGAKPLQNYFRGFESSQAHLNAVIAALRESEDELMRDNASCEMEKQNMWTLMGDLERHGQLAKAVGDEIEKQATDIQISDPDRAKALREEVLFRARQKQQDIATQLAVNVQGYMALDLIKKNNEELIRGVRRASTTTVAALRTAVITAQAVANQKLVLNQISALNNTTSKLIVDTSVMLKQNAVQTQEQATSAVIDVDALKIAFQNVRDTIDSMDTYRLKAITNMEETVNVLGTEVGKMTHYIGERQAITGSRPEVKQLPQ